MSQLSVNDTRETENDMDDSKNVRQTLKVSRQQSLKKKRGKKKERVDGWMEGSLFARKCGASSPIADKSKHSSCLELLFREKKRHNCCWSQQDARVTFAFITAGGWLQQFHLLVIQDASSYTHRQRHKCQFCGH